MAFGSGCHSGRTLGMAGNDHAADPRRGWYHGAAVGWGPCAVGGGDPLYVRDSLWVAVSFGPKLKLWASLDGRGWEKLDLPNLEEPQGGGSGGGHYIDGVFFISVNDASSGLRTMWVGVPDRVG